MLKIDRFHSIGGPVAVLITTSCTITACVAQCCRNLSISDHDSDVFDDGLITGLSRRSDGGQALQRDCQP